MAPEQIRGKRGDARTDVYALGTMLYEMLAGRLPYEESSSVALLRAKVARDPSPPSSRVPGFDPAIEAIIMKAIERDPRDRYAHAADLLADLKDPGSPRTRERPVRPRRRAPPVSRRVASSIAIAVAARGALAWLSAAARDRPAATRLVK
jgi:serine/threonine-protein kinase